MIYHKISLDFFSTKDKKLSLRRISSLCNEPSKKRTKYLLVSQQDMSFSHSGQNLCKLNNPSLKFLPTIESLKFNVFVNNFLTGVASKKIHQNPEEFFLCTTFDIFYGKINIFE